MKFTRSKLNYNQENSVDEPQKVFKVMHIVDIDHVKLDTYQLKGISKIWFGSGRKTYQKGHHR